MIYTLTEKEAQLATKCLDELILLWDRHNIEHSSIYYDIINIIVKLQEMIIMADLEWYREGKGYLTDEGYEWESNLLWSLETINKIENEPPF